MTNGLTSSRFIVCMILVAVLVMLITAAFNYKANRWGIFSDDYQTFSGRIRLNRHWLKTQFLVSENHGYDCILFGSSRVESIDARKLEGNCYNFTHSGGVPENHLAALKIFLNRGLDLKRIYIGLDDISYSWDPAEGHAQHLRRAYPSNVLESIDALIFYLLQPIKLKYLGFVSGSVKERTIPSAVIDPVLHWEKIDVKSRVLYQQPEQQDATFKLIPGSPVGTSYHGASAATAIAEILQLAEKKNIDVVMFFNPLHYKTYLTRNYKNYLDFKSRISKLAPFYDFTGLNHFTTDNRYWKETSHFTSIVGNKIAQVMVSDEERSAGFGRLVRPERLAFIEERQAKVDFGYLEDLIKREVLLAIPGRFVAMWRERDRLIAHRVVKPRDQDNEVLMRGGEFALSRTSSREAFRPHIWTRLRKGNLFLLKYSMSAQYSSTIGIKLRQDVTLGNGDWRSYIIYGEPGRNSGYIAGYVTKANPPIRFQFGPGMVRQEWEPLALYGILPDHRD